MRGIRKRDSWEQGMQRLWGRKRAKMVGVKSVRQWGNNREVCQGPPCIFVMVLSL